jgi:hypothetical protein
VLASENQPIERSVDCVSHQTLERSHVVVTERSELFTVEVCECSREVRGTRLATLKALHGISPIPRICEHLANGAKHFIVNREHRAVAEIERVQGTFDAAAYDASAFDTEPLLITLDAKEAGEFGVEQITAADLARRVLIYWGSRMGQGDISADLSP